MKDSLYQLASTSDLVLCITQNQNMLILVIVRLRWVALLVRVLATDENLAPSLLLQLLLVYTFGTDQ